MIDEQVEPTWPTELVEVLSRLEQGDVIDGVPFGYYATGAFVAWKPSASARKDAVELVEITEGGPQSWIVTTQTCDICEEDSDRPRRPFILLAPIYDAAQLNERQRFMVKNFEISYLVRLTGPEFGDGFSVADLRIQIPFDKGVVVNKQLRKGFESADDARRFGEQLARLYSRPVFPGIVVKHIVDSLRTFYGGGKRLHRDRFEASKIVELRLFCTEDGPPYDVQLWIILAGPGTESAARECIDAWYRSTQPTATASGIALLAPQFQTYNMMSAADYIRTKPISIPYIFI